MTKFPSPYGEVCFNPWFVGKDVAEILGCFRPLTGKLVLIEISDYVNGFRDGEFPSPYGEVGFNLNESGMYSLIFGSFRPLTGKLVLIHFYE